MRARHLPVELTFVRVATSVAEDDPHIGLLHLRSLALRAVGLDCPPFEPTTHARTVWQIPMSLFRIPTDPIIYAVFPQELIDKVIESVDPTDLQTFQACSLVSKSWTYPSWAMLFRSVSITSWGMFQRWCYNTTPGPGGPGSFVHSLTFGEAHGKWITPDALLIGERHLKSFKSLVSFTAIELKINYFFDESQLSQRFGLFCRGVREVRLVRPNGSPRIVASFIQQFPFIQRLSVEFYSETWSPLPEREEYTSIGFTGALQLVSDASTDRRERQQFIFCLTIFPLQYKEISVVGSLGYSWQYQRLLRASSETLKRLRMVDIRPDPWREHSWGWAQGIVSSLHPLDDLLLMALLTRHIRAPRLIA